jgi:hypothetical protein
MNGTGLPAPKHSIDKHKFSIPTKIVEISADSDHLGAVSDEGRVYLKTAKSDSWASANHWEDTWGVPSSFVLNLNDPHNELTRNYRSLVLGRRNQYAKYSEDIDGNAHHFGVMGTTTLYVLSENGQEIFFVDSGLPADFSHQVCGPERGSFISENISVSASTLFVINRFGEMYTKMEDYDLNGGSEVVFNYYYDRRPKDSRSGQDVWTNWSAWALPLEDWRKQPRIPVFGLGKISKDISILQNGEGNAARELRVAGLNEFGQTGYYFKQIYDLIWKFKSAPLEIPKDHLIEPLTPQQIDLASKEARGATTDMNYKGIIDFGIKSIYEVELLDFNLHCTPATLRVHLPSGKYVDSKLHTVEMWAIFYKRHAPGRDGTPKLFFGTLEVSLEALQSKDREISTVAELLKDSHFNTFKFVVSASTDKIKIREAHPVEGGIWIDLTRKSENPFRPLAQTQIEKDTFEFLSQDGYQNLVQSDYLILKSDYTQFTLSAQKTLIEEKIEVNKKMKVYLKDVYELQKKMLKKHKITKEFMSNLSKVLYRMGGEKFPWSPVSAFAQRGHVIFHSFAENGKMLLFKSKKSYKAAEKQVEKRIEEYQKLLKHIY